ncbi:MAG: nucleotidyltransferase domain-containing protein [Candidatus Aegiribacteria sp.]
MKTKPFRDKMKTDILEVFTPRPWVHAVWEGGSAATGFLDDFSDLDLVVVVKDERVEDAFRLFEEYLEDTYGIDRCFRVPEPAWHGHSQSFYFIKDAPPLFYIDFLVEKLSSRDRLLEPERHGRAEVWLDRKGVLDHSAIPDGDLIEKQARYLDTLAGSLPLAVTEVRKQIARGHSIDAVSQYQRFVTARLAGLLNLKYRPAQFDFGIRYAERAYPPEVNRQLQELLYLESFDDLPPALEKAAAWAEDLLKELL